MRAALSIPLAGKRVLDVGCGNGSAFSLPGYTGAFMHGIDVNPHAVAAAALAYPSGSFLHARAEELPYGDASFDVVLSRVALPYTDIRKALAEIHRVLKPRGEFWATMHTWASVRGWWGDAVRNGVWLTAADHLYIVLASLVYQASGYVPARPWNRTRETFQTERAMRRDLKRAGFTDLQIDFEGSNFIVQARRG